MSRGWSFTHALWLQSMIRGQVVLLWRPGGGVEERDRGLMKGGRGSCSCGPCQHICPNGKEPFTASTQGLPFEKKSWEGSRGEAACLYAVSRQQLKTSIHPKKKKTFCRCALKPLFFSNSYHSSVFILICSSTQHPVAPTFSSPTLLCPSHPATWLLWQRYTKWRRGAQSWKAQSGSHFLTDPGLSTERVKTFYAWWIIKSTPWVFSGPMH